MAAILIRSPRHLMGYGDCGTEPCGVSIDLDNPTSMRLAGACGPGTEPYLVDGQVVCLPEDVLSSYPKLPYTEVNGWRMAQAGGNMVSGPGTYVCGQGTRQVMLGANVGCAPQGAALSMTEDGRVVLARPGRSPDDLPVVMPVVSGDPVAMSPVVINAQVAPMTSGKTVYVNPADVAKASSSADMAQAVVEQVTEMANSPEAAAVAASVQDQVQRNPLPFLASIVGGWYRGFWGAMIAGAAAYYLTKPKVQIAVDAAGASLVVDPLTAAHAQSIAANSGGSVNVAGYFAGW